MSTKTTSEDTNDLDDNNNRKTISWDEEIIKEHDKDVGVHSVYKCVCNKDYKHGFYLRCTYVLSIL